MDPRLMAARMQTSHFPLVSSDSQYLYVYRSTKYQEDLVEYRDDMGMDISPDKREERVFIDGVGDGAGAVPENRVEPFTKNNLVKE